MPPVTALQPANPHIPPRGERYRIVVPNTATAPRIARDFVGTVLSVAGRSGVADDVRLCVSEVVTNAHCHTGSPLIRVDVTVNRRQVMVYVSDDEAGRSPEPGTVSATEPCAESGRGLVIVEQLATRWGVAVNDGAGRRSKAVWFVLVEPPSAPDCPRL